MAIQKRDSLSIQKGIPVISKGIKIKSLKSCGSIYLGHSKQSSAVKPAKRERPDLNKKHLQLEREPAKEKLDIQELTFNEVKAFINSINRSTLKLMTQYFRLKIMTDNQAIGNLFKECVESELDPLIKYKYAQYMAKSGEELIKTTCSTMPSMDNPVDYDKKRSINLSDPVYLQHVRRAIFETVTPFIEERWHPCESLEDFEDALQLIMNDLHQFICFEYHKLKDKTHF